MKLIYLFFYKVNYKIVQYYQAYFLRKPEALLALDFIRKDRKFDYRHRYDLKPNALIFDCGGYKGDWTARMLDLYQEKEPRIYVFEIVDTFIKHLEQQFQRNEQVKIFPFGLGSENKTIEFPIDDIATSIFLKPADAKMETGEIRNVTEFWKEHNIKDVDIFKMNIEGGEYELLDTLISAGLVSHCKNIQIQFHNYGEWSVQRRDKIKSELEKTHVCTYDFEWTFENWAIKE